MNIDALKKRLGEISNKNRKSNMLWKPANGKQNIRIVPYAKNPENPFVELRFHYDFNGKNYLSPVTNGNPDPINDLANKLKATGNQDDYKLAMSLFPKLRIYVPVIVRGEEDAGVRFWGFGKQVYQALLGIVADEDYGDITSLKDGNDITVEYLPKEETGKSFPETKILPRPKKTPVGDSKVMEAIKNQPSLTDIFEEPSFEELEAALSEYLNPEKEDDETVDNVVDDSEDKVVDVGESVVAKTTAPTSEKTATKDDFDKLFA